MLDSKIKNKNFGKIDNLENPPPITESKETRIIINDIERTRVKERIFLPNFKEHCFVFITNYLILNEISYKQGLNEIAGTFILLKYKINISYARIYKMFVCFIDKFLTNYYWETEFYSLQSSLSLITILLRYHDTELYNVFEYALISPEMYATSWVLTVFSNKSSIDIVYHLWDKLIVFNDSLFLHFIIVSFLQGHRDKILKTDISQIPSYLSQMAFTSIDEVDRTIERALDLSDLTPSSFRLFSNRLEIFKYRSPRLKELYECYDPDNLLAMPIFPSEILTITYKDSFGCPDCQCVNFDLRKKKFNKQAQCYFCQAKVLENKISFLLLDLRIADSASKINAPEKDKEKIMEKYLPGYLPLSVAVKEEELLDDNYPVNIIQRFNNDKDKYHFMLITSQTDYFKEYEDKFYKEEDTNDDNGNNFGLITKVNKELNVDIVNSQIKKDKKLVMRIKEFDNLKKAISLMLNEKYKYISYIYGGFYEIHSFSMKYNVNLLGHGSECYLCAKYLNSKKGDIFSLFKKIISPLNPLSKPKDSPPKPKLHQDTANIIILNPKPELSVDEISKLIVNPNIKQYTCLYRSDFDILPNVNSDTSSTGSTETTISSSSNGMKEMTIMLFLNSIKVMIYQENKEVGKGNLSYILIRDIEIGKIKSIIQKNQAGNIITLNYVENTDDVLFMTIDFVSDIDSRDFRKNVKRFKARKSLIKK